jgi:hypothetical protein
MNPTSCLFDHSLHRIVFLLACALLVDEKTDALFWFGLRDVGIIYSRVVIQGTIDVFPAFLEHNSAEKITVLFIFA